jgi:hypothetical protein
MEDKNESNRIEACVQTIEENHGLLQSSTDRTDIKAELNENNRNFKPESPRTVNNQRWEIIRYETQTYGPVYVAETWSRVGIDDVICRSYTFDHYPSANDISSIKSAQNLRQRVKLDKIP